MWTEIDAAYIKDEAMAYIYAINNEPRRQIMAFHLAHYFS